MIIKVEINTNTIIKVVPLLQESVEGKPEIITTIFNTITTLTTIFYVPFFDCSLHSVGTYVFFGHEHFKVENNCL